jgi:hypothetical protein
MFGIVTERQPMKHFAWILLALFLVTCTAQGITLGVPDVHAWGSSGGGGETDGSDDANGDNGEGDSGDSGDAGDCGESGE